MTAGNPSLLSPRSSLIRRTISLRLASAHVHLALRPHSTTSNATDTMLSRAHKAYEANPPSRNDLSKQLFPSSSLGNNTQNANIAESFKRPSQSQSRPMAAAASVSARNAASANNANSQTATAVPSRANQLAARPPNPAPTRTPHGSSMASLYAKVDSFQEDPDDLLYSGSQSKTSPAVFFNDDDFSDDENLDLELKQPSSLPLSPKKAGPAPTTSRPLQEQQASQALPSTQSENPVPWSSSPPSHMIPPISRTVSNTSLSKRGSQDAHLPPAKKRSLPKAWAKQEPIDLEDGEDVSRWTSGGEAALPRKRESEPWDPLADVDMKQIKKQPKKPAEDELSKEDIQQITGAHMERNSSKGISLSKEQQRVQDLVVKSGNSVFFTGPAGTGKSVLMRSIITELKKKFARDPERLAVTASTGLAACNIGGITLHSFSGIGLGKDDVPMLVKKIRRNAKAKNRWLKTKVLIVDEISMVDGELFDKLSQIGRQLRNNGRPWGGIQLVITGDFFQLPPVPDFGDKNQKKESKFAFDAATWNTSIDHTIGLTQVFRQKDPVFANMLNEMRLGRISDETVKSFKDLSRPIEGNDKLDLATTELFPTRSEVEAANQTRLRNLGGHGKRYDAHDTGDPNMRDKLLQNMMAPKSLELKVGAQVMLVKNMDDTLVNGSLGKVKTFMSEAMFEVKGSSEYETLDDSNSGHSAKAKARIQAFKKQYEDSQKGSAEYPMVEFAASDGTYRTILCMPEEWKVELPTGEVQASRSQVPLILAWALSIHKAQGQTLERVKVDLGKVFEKGQAYVALSRATTQQGLQVLRFEKRKVMAHQRVVDFYNKLYSVEEAAASKKKQPLTMTGFVNGKGRERQAQNPNEKAKNKVPAQMASFLQTNQGGAGARAGANADMDVDEEEAFMMAQAHG